MNLWINCLQIVGHMQSTPNLKRQLENNTMKKTLDTTFNNQHPSKKDKLPQHRSFNHHMINQPPVQLSHPRNSPKNTPKKNQE